MQLEGADYQLSEYEKLKDYGRDSGRSLVLMKMQELSRLKLSVLVNLSIKQ